MFSSQREEEEWVAEPHVIALVEVDMQEMLVRLLLAGEAIRERMEELEHPVDHRAQPTVSP
jgi:hypothetical protein